MLVFPWQLKRSGILGMNRRNTRYISRYNPRHLYPLVDNKLKTKLLAQQAGIASPALIGVVRSQHDVTQLAQKLEGVDGFAIKPAKGSGGKGILVLTQQSDGFAKNSGQLLSLNELQRHTSNILAGLYSLGGTPDIAIIEELIEFDPQLARYSFEGVPGYSCDCVSWIPGYGHDAIVDTAFRWQSQFASGSGWCRAGYCHRPTVESGSAGDAGESSSGYRLLDRRVAAAGLVGVVVPGRSLLRRHRAGVSGNGYGAG